MQGLTVIRSEGVNADAANPPAWGAREALPMEKREVTVRNRAAKRRAEMRRWRFGVGQSHKEEGAEIERARELGLEAEYVDAQRFARMRAASARQREAHRRRTRERLRRARLGDYGRRELVADLVIEAGKTPRHGWTSAQLARWGVAWPPAKGWRRELVGRWAAS